MIRFQITKKIRLSGHLAKSDESNIWCPFCGWFEREAKRNITNLEGPLKKVKPPIGSHPSAKPKKESPPKKDTQNVDTFTVPRQRKNQKKKKNGVPENTNEKTTETKKIKKQHTNKKKRKKRKNKHTQNVPPRSLARGFAWLAPPAAPGPRQLQLSAPRSSGAGARPPGRPVRRAPPPEPNEKDAVGGWWCFHSVFGGV